MKETSHKMSLLLFFLVAFASYLTPFTAEARPNKPKHDKNCHGHRPPTQPPTLPPTQPPTLPPTPNLPPIPPPTPSPSPYEGFTGACGSPCFDDNDCNYPCPRCLYNSYGNKACTYDLPYFTPPFPSPSSPPPPSLTPSPAPYDSDFDDQLPLSPISGSD